MKATKKGFRYTAPALLLLTGVMIYPLFYVFYLSLHRRLLIFDLSKFVGLENYYFLLRDERFWNALKNTLFFTISSVSLELILGLSLALIVNKPFKGRGIVRAMILTPWAIPTVVAAKMWEWIYNADMGVLNFLISAKINWLGDPFWALWAAILADVWKTTPFVVILLLAGLQVIPQEVYQAAKADGAGTWACFHKITLPLLKPVILVVLIFRTLDAFRVFDVIYVLTGGGPANTTETLSIYAYKMLFQTLQFGYGSALSVVVFLCVGGLSVVYIRVLSRGVK